MYYTITLCVAPGSTKSSFNFAPPIFLSQKQHKKKFSSIGTENGTPSAQMNVGKHHPPRSPTPWSPLPTLPSATSPPQGVGGPPPKRSRAARRQQNNPTFRSWHQPNSTGGHTSLAWATQPPGHILWGGRAPSPRGRHPRACPPPRTDCGEGERPGVTNRDARPAVRNCVPQLCWRHTLTLAWLGGFFSYLGGGRRLDF